MFCKRLFLAACAVFFLSATLTVFAADKKAKPDKKGEENVDQDPYAKQNAEIKRLYESALLIQKKKEELHKKEIDKFQKVLTKLKADKEKAEKLKKSTTKLEENIEKIERAVKAREEYVKLPEIQNAKLDAPADEDKKAK